MMRLWAAAAVAGVMLVLAGAFSAPQAGSPVAATLPPPVSVESPLQRVDIFRQCLQVSQCGLDRNGNRRCGLVWRCQRCNFVRVCTRAAGCNWQEKCTWGPYQPPVQQPLPPRGS
ncbi:MAG: hypothetical protein AB7U38_13145 [Hyphomicrobiales bacterium]